MMSIVEHAGDAYEVVVVASDKPEAPGLIWAREHGIPTFALSPKGIGKLAYEAAISAALREAGAEIIALAGYMRLLSDEFVAEWRGCIVNIHPSLLPAFPGKDAIGQAFRGGVKITGVTIHIVDEGMDTGPIIAQEAVRITEDMTRETLQQAIQQVEHRLYPQVIEEWIKEEANV